MSYSNLVAETRTVWDFNQLYLETPNVESDLEIRQGATEGLSVEGEEETLARVKAQVKKGRLILSIEGNWSDKLRDALATNLTRPVVRYILTVKKLNSLEVTGIARINIARLVTDQLVLKLYGPGNVQIRTLEAALLEVDINSPCKLDIGGKVAVQHVNIGARGSYNASWLKSKIARVQLRDYGNVRLWVTEMLEATVTGSGILEYYGNPQLMQNFSSFGKIVSLGPR